MVYDVDTRTMHTIDSPHGIFSEFTVAESYLKDCKSPYYMMVIVECGVVNEWPYTFSTPYKHNELTYYSRNESGDFERIE